MDLFDVVRSCARRWYVLLPLLLIAAWFAHHVYNAAKPQYYSSAVVGLAPPNAHVDVPEPGVEVPRNGLLQDAGGASMLANLTQLGLTQPSVVAQVVAGGGQPNFTARMFPVPATFQELPLIMIEAEEPDPAAAVKTVELATAQASPALRMLQQQAGVPDDQMATTFTVDPPSAPIGAMPSRTRSTVAVFVGGAGIAILVALLVDVLIMGWKARRQKRRQSRVQATDVVDTRNTADKTDASVTPDSAKSFYPENKHAVAHEVKMDSRRR